MRSVLVSRRQRWPPLFHAFQHPSHPESGAEQRRDARRASPRHLPEPLPQSRTRTTRWIPLVFLNLKPYRVMQTARGTRASVSQRLNNKVIILVNFFTQRCRRRLGECGFGIRVQRDTGQLLAQHLFQLIQQHTAAWLEISSSATLPVMMSGRGVSCRVTGTRSSVGSIIVVISSAPLFIRLRTSSCNVFDRNVLWFYLFVPYSSILRDTGMEPTLPVTHP